MPVLAVYPTRQLGDTLTEVVVSPDVVIRYDEIQPLHWSNRRRPRTDQGPEFTSRALGQWAYERDIELRLIEAGKPTQNAYVESINGKFRDGCPNAHQFLSIEVARSKSDAWRVDYNLNRPHSSLGQLTPREHLQRSGIEDKEAANF